MEITDLGSWSVGWFHLVAENGVQVSCDNGNNPWDSIESWRTLDQVSDSQFLKKVLVV
jgi:hypothetical protein